MQTVTTTPMDAMPARRHGPLVIRAAQMAAFEDAARGRFMDRLSLLVRQALDDRGREATDEQVRQRIETGLRLAGEHGLTWESSIAGFIGLMIDCGETFYREPELQAILTDPTIPPNDRIAALFDRIAPRTWARIASSGR